MSLLAILEKIIIFVSHWRKIHYVALTWFSKNRSLTSSVILHHKKKLPARPKVWPSYPFLWPVLSCESFPQNPVCFPADLTAPDLGALFATENNSQKISASPPTKCQKTPGVLVKTNLFLRERWQPDKFSNGQQCWGPVKAENTVKSNCLPTKRLYP